MALDETPAECDVLQSNQSICNLSRMRARLFLSWLDRQWSLDAQDHINEALHCPTKDVKEHIIRVTSALENRIVEPDALQAFLAVSLCRSFLLIGMVRARAHIYTTTTTTKPTTTTKTPPKTTTGSGSSDSRQAKRAKHNRRNWANKVNRQSTSTNTQQHMQASRQTDGQTT